MASITTIRGLSILTNLADFRADWNALRTLDISNLENLTYVDVSDNENYDGDSNTNTLTQVNFTGCVALEQIRLDDSDFSDNSFASLIGLTGLNNLLTLDLDQCGLSGSIDLTAMGDFSGYIDLSGNPGITEIVISGSQPIIDFNAYNCGLTQESINAILIALDENGESSGYVSTGGLSNGVPSGLGITAYENLAGKGWSCDINTGSYGVSLASDIVGGTVCNADNFIAYYVALDTTIEDEGNILYTDQFMLNTAPDSWYTNGSIRFQTVDGAISVAIACA